MSPKAKTAYFRNFTPDEQVRRLKQRAAELQRKEGVKYCTTQLQLHSEIVGPVKRLVHNLVSSSRTVQITSGSVAKHGADCLGSTPPPHTPRASVSKPQADGAADGEGESAVINGLVAVEDADTGDQWAPHRFARCCDCAHFLSKVLKSAPGSSQMITGFLFCELSHESAQQETVPT